MLSRGERGKHIPQEESKCNSALGSAAHGVSVALGGADEHSQRDGSGKPEDHGQGLENERGQAVENARVVQRCDTDVGEHQERPDRVEDHEVDAVGTPSPVGRCDVGRQGQLNDAEHHSHDVDD